MVESSHVPLPTFKDNLVPTHEAFEQIDTAYISVVFLIIEGAINFDSSFCLRSNVLAFDMRLEPANDDANLAYLLSFQTKE